MNKLTFLSKQSFPTLLLIRQIIIGKTLLLTLLLLILNTSYSKAGEVYYKDFEDDNYETFIEKNELLGNLIGLKNIHTGKVILKAEYDDIVSINEKYVRVIKNKKWGIVDTLGKVVIAINYSKCSNMFEGRIFLTNSTEKIALANSAGLLLTKFIFDSYRHFKDGLAEVKQINQYGFINKQGITVIPIKYASVGIPRAGKVTAKTNSYYSVVLGTVQDMDKPWTKRPNDVVFKDVNNYVLDYSGRVMFASKDEISNMGNGYVMTSTQYGDCGSREGWSSLQIYDKDYKVVLSYKTCWRFMAVANFMIIRNGSTDKYGVYPFMVLDGDFKLDDFIKTPYTSYEDKLYKDADGYQYVKFFKNETEFVYIGMDGNCYQFGESSSCE